MILARIDTSSVFFNDTATTEIYTRKDTLSLHDALPISHLVELRRELARAPGGGEASLARAALRAGSRGRRVHPASRGITGKQRAPRADLPFLSAELPHDRCVIPRPFQFTSRTTRRPPF